jgi:hypothetical protein
MRREGEESEGRDEGGVGGAGGEGEGARACPPFLAL